MTESVFIYKWLREHPLIKTASVCKSIIPKLDPGNFHRDSAAGKEMKPDVLRQMVSILEHYGYQHITLESEQIKGNGAKTAIADSDTKKNPKNDKGKKKTKPKPVPPAKKKLSLMEQLDQKINKS